MKKYLLAILLTVCAFAFAGQGMGPGPGGKGYAAATNTSLLIINNSASNGSTTFADQSANNFTVTRIGTPTYSTAQFVSSATSSGVFNGTDQGLSIADAAPLDLGNVWTMEFWFRANSLATQGTLTAKREASGFEGPWLVYVNTSGDIFWRLSSDGLNWDICAGCGGGNITANTWHHFAIVSDGTTIKPYLDGVNYSGANITSSLALDSGTDAVTVGSDASGVNSFNGYIQSYRLSKTARYTADFTVPTPPLTP